MGRVVKSQLDFGELFPAERTQKTLTVAELTGQIKRLLEKDFREVRVTGEVSNLKIQSSGHIYFSLKDASAQLSCVLFRGEMQVDRSLLQDGRKVVLKGQVTVYEPRGTYQLRVTGVELEGVGALQAAFERLKEKLRAEGLFAPERKRPLPRFPARIGLVTSPTGAAIRDVLHVIERRNPTLEIFLAPCRVQGAGAAAEIATAIQLLNEFHSKQIQQSRGDRKLDLILVTRGGGSLEDLWPFNEEIVARAIYHSALPVVSAVGHEIDFTISDFVADFRAATPSAAAEIVTEGMFAGCQLLSERQTRLRQLTGQQLQRWRIAFNREVQALQRVHPARGVEARAQRLDELVIDLNRCARRGLRGQVDSLKDLAERLARVRPQLLLDRRREQLDLRVQRLKELLIARLRDRSHALSAAISGLRLLGPEQVLARGYSITTTETGEIIRNAGAVQPGQILRTRVKAGGITSRVEEVDGADSRNVN